MSTNDRIYQFVLLRYTRYLNCPCYETSNLVITNLCDRCPISWKKLCRNYLFPVDNFVLISEQTQRKDSWTTLQEHSFLCNNLKTGNQYPKDSSVVIIGSITSLDGLT